MGSYTSLDNSICYWHLYFFFLPLLTWTILLTLTHIHWVECMYEVWKEKRPDFTVCTFGASELNMNNAQKYMLDEMRVELLLEKTLNLQELISHRINTFTIHDTTVM